MFDRYFVDARGRVGERVGSINMEVVERRAPTDESVRLLREMETAAEAKVLASIPLAGNAFKGEMLIRELQHRPGVMITVLFDFNGKRCKVNVDIDKNTARPDVGQRIHAAIAEEIARQAFEDMLSPETIRALNQGLGR